MSTINVTLRGNVGGDPETKFLGETFLVSFSVGCTPRIQKNKEWIDGETVWFRVSMFGRNAEGVADELRKGDAVVVTGSLVQTTYQNKSGETRTSLDVRADHIGIIPKPPKVNAGPSW